MADSNVCLFIPGAFHRCTADQVKSSFETLFGIDIIDKVDESLRSNHGIDFKHFWIHFKHTSPSLQAFIDEINLKGMRPIYYNSPYVWKVQINKPKLD